MCEFKEFKIITEPSPKDAEGVFEMLNKTGDETDSLPFGRDEFEKVVSVDKIRRFFEIQQRRKFCVFAIVKSKNDEVVGCSIAFPRSRHSHHVFEFGVSILKEYEKQGLHHIVMKTMIEEVDKLGAWKISSHVRSDNTRAIDLYEKYGFEKEGFLTDQLKVGNEYYDELIMGLLLHKARQRYM